MDNSSPCCRSEPILDIGITDLMSPLEKFTFGIQSVGLNMILHRLGCSLAGWLHSLLQTWIMLILLIAIFCTLLGCVRNLIIWSLTQQSQHIMTVRKEKIDKLQWICDAELQEKNEGTVL